MPAISRTYLQTVRRLLGTQWPTQGAPRGGCCCWAEAGRGKGVKPIAFFPPVPEVRLGDG